MVGVCMGQKNGVNIGWQYSGQRKIGSKFSAPLFETAGTRINQDRAPPPPRTR